MTFTLHVDADLWRANATSVRDAINSALTEDEGTRGLVPVIKGNGYGLTKPRLAREAAALGVDAVAVGTPYEVYDVAQEFDGDILVLQPWDPRDQLATKVWEDLHARLSMRVIRTVASTDVLHRLAADATSPVSVVLEGLTSMRRFGLAEADMDALLADTTIRAALRDGRIDIRGAALHLPMTQPSSPSLATLGDGSNRTPASASNRVREAWGWAAIWIRALAAMDSSGVPLQETAASIWVSHLDDTEIADLRTALPTVPLRLRIGTRLWLGEPTSLQAYGTVLAVNPVERGREVGYRQRRAPKDGYVVVVGGGTAHGVGMAAPAAATSMRQRAISAATGALEAVGRARSPFTWAGKHRWFAEPPHMQVSLIWLSEDDVREALAAGHRTPVTGDQWTCRVRHTTAMFDWILGLD